MGLEALARFTPGWGFSFNEVQITRTLLERTGNPTK
jgi:hypothetical protein